ncbi:MAG: hypothetical protein KAS23_02455 [Anaerohalosphaera sp.]|nr:hypothetical protein [Anaerohalosphaera sp.]
MFRKLLNGKSQTTIIIFIVLLVLGVFSILQWLLVQTSYVVIVKNESLQPIESLEVYGGGAQFVFVKIAAGETQKKRLFFKHDGDLRYKAIIDGKQTEGTIEGYVTGSFNGSKTIQIDQDGIITLK